MNSQVSWKKPLILALLLFVFGMLTYWSEFKKRPEKEMAEQQSKRLFLLKENQVVSFKVKGKGTAEFELKCLDLEAKLCKSGDNSKWEIQQPWKARADDSNVNALISAANNLMVEETVDLRQDSAEKRGQLLRDYGLNAEARKDPAKPRFEVALNTGEHLVLQLGIDHPFGGKTFALLSRGAPGQEPSVDETRVYLIPDHFKSNFDRDMTYWRDKKILTLGAQDIRSFDLKSPKGSITADREDGQWTIRPFGKKKGEEEVAGDLETLESVVNAAAYLTAKAFPTEQKEGPDGKKILKGAKPMVVMTFRKSDTEKVSLVIYSKDRGKEAPLLLATASNVDPIYELEAGARNRFEKSFKELRATKLITSLERLTTRRIEVSGKKIGETPVVLSQKDGKWVADATQKREPNPEKIQKLLDELASGKIREFLANAPAPTNADEEVTLSLGDERIPNKRKFSFWSQKEKLYARDLTRAQRGGRGEAFEVDKSLQAALPWKADLLWAGANSAANAAASPVQNK